MRHQIPSVWIKTIMTCFLIGDLIFFSACKSDGFKASNPSISLGDNSSLENGNQPQPSQPPPNPMPMPSPIPNPAPIPNPMPQPNPQPMPAPAPIGNQTPGPVPSHQLKLSDFGGVPNASSTTIINAFNQAFARLKSLGGGTLTVDPGTYQFGSLSGGVAVNVSDLRNVVISAYGAHMRMSSSNSTPVFFQFMNPNNITIKGMSFYDSGTNLNINWRGAICIYFLTTTRNSGFKMVDVVAENVVALLQGQQDSNYYTFEGFDIHATVKNAYYGVNPNMTGANSKANLTTFNVRRAFIGYGVKNWDITVNASADGVAPGSNALIELAADNRGPVDGVNVNLTVSGNMQNYQGLVTLFHQASSGFRQYIRNVKANVTVNNLSAAPGSVFYFPYWDPATNSIMGSTISTWEQIQLSGAINGNFSGSLIKNPSISSGTTNSISVASNLAAYQNMNSLPRYFKVGP